jgi:hypothetical protein
MYYSYRKPTCILLSLVLSGILPLMARFWKE